MNWEHDMDILYGVLALALWLATWGLARACEALRGKPPAKVSGTAAPSAAQAAQTTGGRS